MVIFIHKDIFHMKNMLFDITVQLARPRTNFNFKFFLFLTPISIYKLYRDNLFIPDQIYPFT